MDAPSDTDSPALPEENSYQFPSVVALVLVVAAMLGVLFYLGSIRGNQGRDSAKSHLKQLGIYIALYESRFKAYPPDAASFERFLRDSGTDGKAMLTCPECHRPIETVWETAPSGSFTSAGGDTPYTWSSSGITDGAPPDLPIAWHRCSLPGKEGAALYFQGRVDVFAAGSPTEKGIEELAKPQPK